MFFIGKRTISTRPCSIAMLNYQRVATGNISLDILFEYDHFPTDTPNTSNKPLPFSKMLGFQRVRHGQKLTRFDGAVSNLTTEQGCRTTKEQGYSTRSTRTGIWYYRPLYIYIYWALPPPQTVDKCFPFINHVSKKHNHIGGNSSHCRGPLGPA